MKHLADILSPADLKGLAVEQLPELAEELRQEIISIVADTGGHLASNLGAVELTVALHYVLDTPRDKIVWDVSHQTYAHKLLTGRRENIRTLRQYGGLSGFARREESEYDAFGAGHASTSISAALGFAAARDLKGEDHKVVAVIGDGAMTGGLAFEGMNNAGSLKKDLLVVLNDNTWSISKNVGAISKYLTSIMADEKFTKLRAEVWELTGRFKRREQIRETIKRLENSIKNFLVPGMLFEKLGFRYFGPIDGHDVQLLVKTLKDIKNLHGPIMLHVATVKGKGYAPSEEDAYTYHGVGKFNKVTGKSSAGNAPLPSYTEVFGRTMIELAEKDPRVVAVTAAMSSGTGLDGFAREFPDRFYDVGIAEAHAACFSAALAAEGVRPYLTVYSTFMQRAYDQVIHDMAIQKLPVVICMDRGGLAGNDGPTHHGVFDLVYLATVPNITVAAPKDGNELRAMLHYTIEHDLPGVIAIRYPRDTVPSAITETPGTLDWGRWDWLTEPGEIVVIAVGTMVHESLKAVAALRDRGIAPALISARFVKPFDEVAMQLVLERASTVVTVEEGSLRGGFGQAAAEYLMTRGFAGKFQALGIPEKFVGQGSRAQLLREIGLDAEGIASAISRLLESHDTDSGSPTGTGSRLLSKLVFRRNGRAQPKVSSAQTSLYGADPE